MIYLYLLLLALAIFALYLSLEDVAQEICLAKLVKHQKLDELQDKED